MTLVEFIQQCSDQNYRSIVRCLEGLTPDELSWGPDPPIHVHWLHSLALWQGTGHVDTVSKQGCPTVVGRRLGRQDGPVSRQTPRHRLWVH